MNVNLNFYVLSEFDFADDWYFWEDLVKPSDKTDEEDFFSWIIKLVQRKWVFVTQIKCSNIFGIRCKSLKCQT